MWGPHPIMAVTFDAVSSGGGNGTGPFTVAHTCSGSNRVLCVNVAVYDSADVPSSVTYNGVAMTSIGSAVNGQYSVYQYYLIAPATGSNNISVSVTGNVFDLGIIGISMTDVDQTIAIGTQATATGTNTTPTVNVSSAANELIVDALIIIYNGTLTVGAGQTERAQGFGGSGFTKHAGSTEDGAGTVTMSWSNTTSQTWAIAGTPFKPVSGAVGQPAHKRTGGTPYMTSSFSPRIW